MVNSDKPIMEVHHAELERDDPKDNSFRSSCPACKIGLLLVKRDQEGLPLREDACIACGQRVYYLDIALGPHVLPPRKASWKVQGR
jgi:hypothetical protein